MIPAVTTKFLLTPLLPKTGISKNAQGLCTSPEAFQELMRNIFGHSKFVLIYIDNILIYNWVTEEEHQEFVRQVVDICLQNNIRINLAKSIFGVEK